MGRLSPKDIRDQDFKQSPLGYSKEQVNEFLEEISEEVETLIKESNDLHTENKEVRLALKTYMNVEDSLKETLLLAQKTAQETLKNAQEQADVVLRKANTEKEALLFAAQQDLSEIKKEIRRLLVERDAILVKLKSSLRTNLETLEEAFSNRDEQESLLDDAVLGDENIVDFSKHDLTVEDLPPVPDEPEISIPGPDEDFTRE